MAKRLSQEFLFSLRNHIPIKELIKHHLHLPSKTTDQVFRFQCPKCHEFQTAINYRANLARCFLCSTNFNNIDLVMIDRQVDFLKAVEILKILLRVYSRPEITK